MPDARCPDAGEQNGDAIGQGIVIELGDAVEALRGPYGMGGEDRQLDRVAQPHGREVHRRRHNS